MSDVIFQINHGATYENDLIHFTDGLHTAIEPIFLDADLSIEEFVLDVEVGSLAYEVDTDMAIIHKKGDADPYTGEYHITPAASEQVLLTANRYLNDNITVDPIPSNYGLIEWNGSVLTVS